MLGSRVGSHSRSRCARRDRAVVDYPSAARPLALHEPEGGLGTEERACQVRVDDRLPTLEGDLLQRHGWGADTGIVEEQVQAPKFLRNASKQSLNGSRFGHVRRDGNGARTYFARRVIQRGSSTACEDKSVAGP